MSTSTSKPLKPKRGTTAQNNAYTGEAYEVTLDTDKKTLVVHDGLTAGGTPLAKEEEVSSLDSTLRALIAEEAAKALAAANTAQSSADAKLPLTGGTMTGGISFPSGYLYSDSSATNGHFSLIGGNGWGQGATLRLLNAREGGGWDLRAHNGTTETLLEGSAGGPLKWGDDTVLTSAGGELHGTIFVDGISDIIKKVTNNDRTCIWGGDYWERCAYLELFGGDNTGRAQLNARNGINASSLTLYPDGNAWVNGGRIYTTTEGFLLNSTNVKLYKSASVTLPSGGTWFVVGLSYQSVLDIFCDYLAGGTKVSMIDYGGEKFILALRVA